MKHESEFIAALLNTVAALVVVLDRHGRIVAFNHTCEQATGYGFDEVKGKCVWDLFLIPEEVEYCQGLFQKLVAGDYPLKITNTWRTRDGGRRLIEWSCTALGGMDGSVEYVIGTGIDITERSQAAEALAAAQERLQFLVSAAPTVIYTCKPEGDYAVTFISDSIEMQLGYRPQDFLNDPGFWVNRIHPEDAPEILAQLPALVEKGHFTHEYRFLARDGAYRWMHDEGRLIRDHQHRPVEIIGYWIDITDRKEAEAALRQSEARYRLLAENVRDVIWTTDLNFNFTYVSPAIQFLTGFTPEETRNLPLERLLTPSSLESARKTLAEQLTLERLRPRDWPRYARLELEMNCQDGATVWAEVNASILRDSQGQAAGILGVTRDLSERRRAEATLDEKDEQLRRAQRMEAVGTLAGGIAHEFNNILASIMGFTELALDKEGEGNSVRYELQKILRAGERARDLVRQLLTFSRQEEQERYPAPMGPIVKEALRFIRPLLPTTIDLRQKIVSSGLALVDPQEIHQVLMNLCANAGHALRRTGGVLEVRLEEEELGAEDAARHELPPGSYLQLTVRDNGEGMRREVMEHIFDPFFTTKGPQDGTGLGLSVVHGIVQGHGGAISVASEAGLGSTFVIYLPKLAAGATPAFETLREAAPANPRILLVEDEDDQLEIWEGSLKRLGYEVVSRRNGLEALEVFREQPQAFDLVVTDQTMPRLSGVELAQEIKRLRPDLPIILITGFSEAVSAEKAVRLGIEEFLMKPVSLKDLADTIRRLLHEEISRWSLALG